MINLETELNEAQYAAATCIDGPLLVIAGAGSGKTRTLVYRMAHMAELGIEPSSILLLTFTRKASQSMLQRAERLIGSGLSGVCGGTFHAFAYGILRHYRPSWLERRDFTVMDNEDMLAMVRQCKEELNLGKNDRSFPKSQNVLGILSKARNKEISVEDVLRREAAHLLPHTEALRALDVACRAWRRKHALLDYDDLLFDLEESLRLDQHVAEALRSRFSHIMVDEYQDTNLVQARITRLLAGESGNIMAVGDDAQSIYAFRGANVRNILDFKAHFPAAKVIALEENYRSTQPILNLANAVLAESPVSYKKHLFTRREKGEAVRLVEPTSDFSQAALIVERIRELSREYPPGEMAVLFRAGFHSYQLEMALTKAGVPFRKYGGMRYAEAAHVKDVVAFARLVVNSLDLPAFTRVASMHKGIGPKTVLKLHGAAMTGNAKDTEKAFAKYPTFLEDMRFLDGLRSNADSPAERLTAIIEHYRPRMEEAWPDDWPKRLQGLEIIGQMADDYDDLDLFLADLTLDIHEEREEGDRLTLSTIHSAKGLEWKVVFILDLVEDRFPSRHAMASDDDFEEERRLFYVAATRAKDLLELYVPATVYNKADRGVVRTMRSPLIRRLASDLYEGWREGPTGLVRGGSRGRLLPEVEPGFSPFSSARSTPSTALRFNLGAEHSQDDDEPEFASLPGPESARRNQGNKPLRLGFCRHKIFGRGKMIHFIEPDKYQVNFPGFGLKVIMADYLIMED